MIASHIQIVQALASLRPGAQWHLVGDEFDSSEPINLEWLDENQSRPTDQEIFESIPAE
jgi:hypothetical protein